MPDFVLVFGVIAVILTVAALASGLVERSPLSFPLMFLGPGFLLSSHGFEAIEIEPDAAVLEVVATLTLALVLFLDASKLQVDELGRRWVVPALILGPGTGLIILAGALPLVYLLDFGWSLAFIGGAVLASTDPVVLRELVRDERIPQSVRQILRIEAGMNDIVVLPVILVLIAVATHQSSGPTGWGVFMVKLLILGPAIVPALVLAGLVIFVIRPSVLAGVLARARMSWRAHAFVGWFGPRGLNSLLLALLVVHAGVPGAELLQATVGVVVLASVAIHGASAGPVAVW